MSKHKQTICAIVALLTIMTFGFAGDPVSGPTGRVLPKIGIAGLDGAAHWLYFEAEDMSDFYFSYGGGLNYSASPQTSGRKADGPVNYVRWDGYDDSWMQWNALHVPASMAAPKLLVNYISEFRVQRWTVHVGAFVGQPEEINAVGEYMLDLSGDTGSQTPTKWTMASLNAVSAGDHILGLHLRTERAPDGGGLGGGYDGFLLYDGNIDASGHGTTVETGGTWWKNDNHAADYRNIEAPVTPVITVSGAQSYRVLLNGQSYTSGMPITEPGDYRLTVVANGYSSVNLIQQRIMAGADFRISRCGDAGHPYPLGDLDSDCYVGLADLGRYVENWLIDDCVFPDWCGGADLDHSQTSDLGDFTMLAGNWGACTDPAPPCNYTPPVQTPTTFSNSGYSFGGNEGASWFDYNNDGYLDVYAHDTVRRNNAGSGFVRAWTSYFRRCITADYDNDGYLDLFVNGSGSQPRLLHNNSGSSFFEVSFPIVPDAAASNLRNACWADFDNDGYVDLYLGGEENAGVATHADRMYHNDEGASFTLLWEESAGFAPARGITACDFDEDGDIDIYVSNYRLRNNRLWVNGGVGNFTEQAALYGVQAGGGHSIGASWGDMDNDGHIDLFAGNLAHAGQPESRFLRNLGEGGNYHFQDKSTSAGLHYQESYCSPALGDYDNDGDLDLFLTTVYGGDSCVLYRNDGNWRFTDVTSQAGLAGLRESWSAAWGDYDDDGDLDLVAKGMLFNNDGNSNHWLKVRLNGDGSAVNRSAVGAQVRIRLGSQTLTRQVEAGTGFAGQNDLTLHFGLGSYSGPVDLEVFWPDGTDQVVSVTTVNQTVSVWYQ